MLGRTIAIINLTILLVLLTGCDTIPSWIYDPAGSAATSTAPLPTKAVMATGTPIDAVRATPTVLPGEEELVPGQPGDSAASTADAAELGGESCTDALSGNSMTYREATIIAQFSECAENGDLLMAHFCNSETGTWWLALSPERDGCNPACIVDVSNRSASVNWRCTGLDDPATEVPPTAENTGELASSGAERFFGWEGVIYRQPAGSLVEYRLLRDDDQWFDLGTRDSDIHEEFASAAWNAARVTITGEMASTPGLIYVDALLQKPLDNNEPRDLTAFAMPAASSHLIGDSTGYYSAWSAVDGVYTSPWCEGVEGPGIGEWLSLEFSAPVEITAIDLTNGFDDEGYLYDLNNRVQTISIFLDSQRIASWELSDYRGVQSYGLGGDVVPGIVATSVQLLIEQTIPGWEYDDTCIAEIAVWGRPAG